MEIRNPLFSLSNKLTRVVILRWECNKISFASSAVVGKMFLESNASSIRGTYFRLGYAKVPRIEEAFDSRNLLLSTALDPISLYLINLKIRMLLNTLAKMRIERRMWEISKKT